MNDAFDMDDFMDYSFHAPINMTYEEWKNGGKEYADLYSKEYSLEYELD